MQLSLCSTIFTSDFLAVSLITPEINLISPDNNNDFLPVATTTLKTKKHQVVDHAQAPAASDLFLNDILGESTHKPLAAKSQRNIPTVTTTLKTPQAPEHTVSPTASDIILNDILGEPTKHQPRPPKQPYALRPTPKHIAQQTVTSSSNQIDDQQLFAALETHSPADFAKLLTCQPYRWQTKFNDQGYTLLMRAIQLQNLELILKLLYYGADCRLGSSVEKTPLNVAIDTGNIDVVRALLSRTKFSKTELKNAIQYISQRYLLNRNLSDPKYFKIAELLAHQIRNLPAMNA